MKKFIKILYVVLLSILLVIGLIIFFKEDKKEEKKVNVLEYGIKEEYVIDKNFDSILNDYYIVLNDNNIEVYNLQNKLLFEYKDEYELYTNDEKYIYIHDENNISKIIDLKGNVIKEGKIILIEDGNIKYFYIDNKLYDYNLNELYTFENLDLNNGYIYAYKNIIYTYDLKNNISIDINTKKEIYKDYKDITFHGDYILYNKDNKYDLYNIKTKEIISTYDKIFDSYFYSNGIEKNEPILTLIKNDEKKYLINNKIVDKATIELDKNHIVDFSICEIGGKLKDSKDNILIDECLNDIKVYGNIVLGTKENQNKFYVNYKDKTIDDGYYSIVNDYIIENSDKEGIKNYNFNGKVKGNYELIKINNGYIGIDNDNKVYFLDKNLKKISESYKSITCDKNNFCSVENNNGYKALYYLNKKITEFEYSNIEFNDDLIILDTLFEKIVVRVEKGIQNKKISKINHKYDTIDIDNIIKKYNLKNEKIIKENKVFFKQFAYILENNDNLGNYKKYVYDLFNVLVDNEKYLNKPYFFNKLSLLKIRQDSNLNVAGEYNDSLNLVSLNNANEESTIYHELSHFLDFSFNDIGYIEVWNCNNKIITNNDYYKLNQEEKNKCEKLEIDDYNADYIVEGGAELITAKYLTNVVSSYYDLTAFISGLEYIFGSDKINEIFFSENGYLEILKLFVNSGFTVEEYKSINKDLSFYTYPTRNLEHKVSNNLVDVLIDLYKANIKNKNWYEDKAFIYILNTYIGVENINYKNGKYGEEVEKFIFKDFEQYYKYENKLLETIEYMPDFNVSPIPVFIVNNELYLGTNVTYYKDNKKLKGYVSFKYDFKNSKLSNYKLIENDNY
ncbi:MAG: hypothetical protein E7157_04300 [Lactobacillales bacterium]|nr:hypothetical protein [Lactobacillales bacterium]